MSLQFLVAGETAQEVEEFIENEGIFFLAPLNAVLRKPLKIDHYVGFYFDVESREEENIC